MINPNYISVEVHSIEINMDCRNFTIRSTSEYL